MHASDHGTRVTYRRYRCRCLPCKAANAAYEQARRQMIAKGQTPLRSLMDAALAEKFVKGLLIDGFTFLELARQFGTPCGRFQLRGDRVTVRTYLKLRRLYRLRVADSPADTRIAE